MSQPPLPATTRLRFAGFEVYPLERRLLKDGEPVLLGDRAFEMLRVLAERPGQLVRKDELLDRVWPGRVVEENNLPVQVRLLRKALGADVIATVPGYGYRFCAVLLPPDDAPAEAVAAAPEAAAAPAVDGQDAAPLFGRSDELRQATEWLQTAPGVCVTLAGPSGVGKTALAQAVMAAQAARSGAGGRTTWVDLAPVSQDDEVMPAVCRALGIQVPDASAEAAIAGVAREVAGHALLVLDNAEHVVAGVAALVAGLHAAAPGLKLLVTTQVPLQVHQEQVLHLGPLALPADDEPATAALQQGAVGLLVARMRAGGSRLPLGEAQLPLLRELCSRLDGLPLALEMAAARVPLLGLRGVIDALDERFAMLRQSNRDRPDRHRSLQAALDWSHALLAPDEQRLLRWLGVFAGGCTLDLLVAVAAEDGESSWDLVDRLAVLVDHSLVVAEPTEPPRYRLLESIRLYAVARLDDAGETDAAHRRHARALQDLLHDHKTRALAARGVERHALYLPALAEFDNVREAQRWALAHAPAQALRLAIAMGWFTTYSELRGQAADLMARCEPLVDAAATGLPADLQSAWLSEFARHLLMRGNPRALGVARRAAGMARGQGDDRTLLNSLMALVRATSEPSDELMPAVAEMEAVIARQPDWAESRLLVLSTRAFALGVMEDWAGVLAVRLEELAMARQHGLLAAAETAESNVVMALNSLGRHEEAVTRAQAATAAAAAANVPASGNSAYMASALVEALVSLGRQDEALREARGALAQCRRFGVLDVQHSLCRLLLQQGRWRPAACWLGRLIHLNREAGSTLNTSLLGPPALQQRARDALGVAEWQRLLDLGTGLSDADADALLFASDDQADDQSPLLAGPSSKP